MIILFIISVLLAYTYNPNSEFFQVLNLISSRRIYFMNKFVNTYSLTLFGNKLNYISSIYSIKNNVEAMILDNSYLIFLLKYGVINTFIIGILLFKMLKNFGPKNDKIKMVITGFLIFGLFESGLIHLNTNIFLIYISTIFYPNSFIIKK